MVRSSRFKLNWCLDYTPHPKNRTYVLEDSSYERFVIILIRFDVFNLSVLKVRLFSSGMFSVRVNPCSMNIGYTVANHQSSLLMLNISHYLGKKGSIRAISG